MKRSLTGFVWAALAVSACAQSQLSAAVLYHPGEPAKDQGLALKAWGSGSISQTDETAYSGAYSIQISTRNFFQGGIMSYAAPQDLASKYEDKNNLLKITFKTADEGARGFGSGKGSPSGPGGKGIPGVPGGGGFGGPGGRGFPGGPGGIGGGGAGRGGGRPGGGQGGAPGIPGGFPGGPGGQGGPGRGQGGAPGIPGGFPGGFPGGQGGRASQPETLRTLRLVVTTTDGKRSEAYVPVDTSSSKDQGWSVVAVPLQAINGFDRTNKVIKEISFSGDATSTFYVGDLRVVNDSTPITGEITNSLSLNLALGDTVTFHASGTGGSSILKYSWDFGTNDGIQEDALGQTVPRKFRKPGTYRVTLTISDLYGLKAPHTSHVDVKVNG